MGFHLLALVRVLLLLAAFAGLPSCAPGRAPELVEVREVGPHSVERGTRLELEGAGFPERRAARVAFVGEVFRPGEAPRQVTIRATAHADSRSQLALGVGPELLGRFLDGAAHATFRGEVVVGFSARSQEAPALSGKLDRVVLDFFGDQATRHGAELRASEEGKAFSEFLGLRLSETFEVTEVRSGGEGERAGLLVGDRVVAVDGVRVDTLGDLSPRPDGRESELVVRRPGVGEFARPIDRGGFRPLRLADLAQGVALVGAALVLLVLLVGTRGRWWALLEARWGERVEAARREPGGTARLLASGAGELAPILPRGFGWVPYAGFFALSAMLSAVALGRTLVGEGIDLALLVFSAAVATVVAGFASGGRVWVPRRRRYGLRLGAGLWSALRALSLFVPVLIALAAAIYQDGTLALQEIVARQGGSPAEWRALGTPWSLVSFVVMLLVWVPARDESAASVTGARPGAGDVPLSDGLARLLDGAALVMTCGLAAAVFLGGWALPWDALGASGPSFLGAAVYLGKTWLLLHGVLFWRRLVAARRSELSWRWRGGASVVAAACFALHVVAVSSSWSGPEAVALSLMTRATLAGVSLVLLLRLARAARQRLATSAINPWL